MELNEKWTSPNVIYAPLRFSNNPLLRIYYEETLFEKESTDNIVYSAEARALATETTSSSIELLNRMIGDDYKRRVIQKEETCTYDFVCARYLPDSGKNLVTDPRFISGISKWNKNIVSNGKAIVGFDFQYANSSPPSGIVSVRMNSHHSLPLPVARAGIFQEVSIPNQSLEKLFFHFDALSTKGTCIAFGGCMASGMAGYYVCVADKNGVQLGCSLFGRWKDTILLQNEMGYLYEVRATSIFNPVLISENRYVRTVNLKSMINQNFGTIDVTRIEKVIIGLIAMESSKPSDTYCLECQASASAIELNLRSSTK